MTWMMPLLEMTSAMMTFASFTITPSLTVKDRGCPFAASAFIQSETSAAGTFALTTW